MPRVLVTRKLSKGERLAGFEEDIAVVRAQVAELAEESRKERRLRRLASIATIGGIVITLVRLGVLTIPLLTPLIRRRKR